MESASFRLPSSQTQPLAIALYLSNMAARGVAARMFYALLWRDGPAPSYGSIPSFPAPEKRGKILYFSMWVTTFPLGCAEGSRSRCSSALRSPSAHKVLLNAQELKKKELPTPAFKKKNKESYYANIRLAK